MTRVFFFLCAAVLLSTGALVAAVRWEEPGPETPSERAETVGVREWACPSGTVGRASCKYISVPEDYDDPEIKQIQLFVSVITPPLAATGAPIVFLGTELGGTTVGKFGDWNLVARSTGRQIILVDLRGSGRSEPRLSCGGRLSSVPWLEAQLSGRELQAAEDEIENAIRGCHSSLADISAVDAYSLDAVARDIDMIRQRLGLEHFTIAAGGEATFVARRAEQLAPDTVDSLVLLGATASTADRHIARYEYAHEVLGAVLDEDQQTLLDEAVESLSGRSVEFAVSSGGRTRRVSVGREVVQPVLARAVEDPKLRELLPTLLTERFPAGQWRLIASLRNAQYRPNGSWSAGLAFTVLCGDPSIPDAAPLSEAIVDFDSTWLGLIDDPTLDPGYCKVWDAPPNVAVSAPPVAPTLVVNGELDVRAPASAAAEIAGTWPDARVVTVPASGQPRIFDPCVIDLLTSFLDAPTSKIDTSCV